MKKNNKAQQKITPIQYNDNLIFYTLLLTILIVPLALRFSSVNFMSPVLADDNIMGPGLKVNVFTHVKFIWLMVFTVITTLLLVYRTTIASYNFQPKWLYISLGSVFFGLILSVLFASHKTVALFGDYMRFEGTLTYISYFILFFAALQINVNTKKLNLLGYALYPFVIINSTLSTLYFYGHNILTSPTIAKLLGLTSNIKLSDSSRLIGTLDNINYFSGAAAIMIGLFLTWSMFDSNWIRSGLNFVMAILSGVMLFASTSTSGFITLIVLLGILFFLLPKSEIYIKALATYLLFVFILGLTLLKMNTFNGGVWLNTFGFFGISPTVPSGFVSKLASLVVGLAITSIAIRFIYKSSKKIKVIALSSISLVLVVLVTALLFQSINSSRGNLMSFESNKQVPTTEQQQGSQYIPKLPTPGISAGAGRAYIWEATMDMVKERPIVGYGMDAYAYVFNQDDPNKYAGLNDYNIIVDKPHSLYLDFLVGSGLFAFFGLLGLIGFGFYFAIRWGIQTKKISQSNAMIFGLIVSTAGYFIQGLFNDSVIGLSIFTWVFFAISINKVLARD